MRGWYVMIPTTDTATIAKRFPDGFRIQPHSHRRDQLVYADDGTTRLDNAS